MTSQPTTYLPPSTPEPTDEECMAVAMLLGLKFDPGTRVYGRKVIKRFNYDDLFIEYLDPVTLEVIHRYNGQGQFAGSYIERPIHPSQN